MSIMCYGENALHLRVKFMFCQKNKYGLFMIHYEQKLFIWGTSKWIANIVELYCITN